MKLTLKCDHCDVEFEGNFKSNVKWRFCNRECLRLARTSTGVIGKSRHRILERECLSCKKVFQYTLHDKYKQYCDRKCAASERKAGGIIAVKVDEATLKSTDVRRAFQNVVKIRSVLKERYGVEYVSQIPGMGKRIWRKAHETKKRNGTYASSKIEKLVKEELESTLTCVQTQVVIGDRPIDFQIELDDEIVYLQVDGRYWHGLDRAIEDIKVSTSPRDQSIYQRWISDREQDDWFSKQGLCLVRITDNEAKEWLKEKSLLQRITYRTKLMTSLKN